METQPRSTFLVTAEEQVKFYEEQAESDKAAARLFAVALFKLERSFIKLQAMHTALLGGEHWDAAEILSAGIREVSESQLAIVNASQKMSGLCHIAFTERLNELRG